MRSLCRKKMMVPTFKNRLVVFFSNYHAEKKRCYIPVSRKKPKDQRCRNGFENEVNFFSSKLLLFFILRRLASLGLCFSNYINISAPTESYFQKKGNSKMFDLQAFFRDIFGVKISTCVGIWSCFLQKKGIFL